MKAWVIGCLAFVGCGGAAVQGTGTPFEVKSADGAPVTGQIDAPPGVNLATVVFVAGTGPFDRDAAFGLPGAGERAKIFKDLSARLAARGVGSVRYDKRGVKFGAPPAQAVDAARIVTATTGAQRDDLAAVYALARERTQGGARCVALFGHSEGMAHIGRLASSGAPAPGLVVGVGAIMISPKVNFYFNGAERDEFSLRLMDADGDGRTTNEEVRAGWAKTPSAVYGVIAPYLHPNGVWAEPDLVRLRTAQAAAFEQQKAQVMAQPDTAPWPSAANPGGSYQWWKSWYSDDTPVAERLAAWNSRFSLHYGTIDSQVEPKRQAAAASAALAARPLSIASYPDRGHSLGTHVTYAPMDEAAADRIADEIAEWAKGCRGAA